MTSGTLEDTRPLRTAQDDFYDLLSDNSDITSAIFLNARGGASKGGRPP